MLHFTKVDLSFNMSLNPAFACLLCHIRLQTYTQCQSLPKTTLKLHQTRSQANTKHDTGCNVPVQQLYISYRSVLIQTQTQSLCQSHPTVHHTMSKPILPVLRDSCANTKTHSQTDFVKIEKAWR